MDNRRILYSLVKDNSKFLGGIVYSLYNDKKSFYRAIANVKASLNTFFLNSHQVNVKVQKDWKQILTKKALFEFFTMQNKLISIFLSKKTNNQRREVVTKCKNYLDLFMSGKDTEYGEGSGYEVDYLFPKDDYLEQSVIYTEKLNPLSKEEKECLSNQEIVDTLCSCVEKYYNHYINDKVAGDSINNAISFEEYVSSLDYGKYKNEVKAELINRHQKELQEFLSIDFDREEDIETYNRENANPASDCMLTNFFIPEEEKNM